MEALLYFQTSVFYADSRKGGRDTREHKIFFLQKWGKLAGINSAEYNL